MGALYVVATPIGNLEDITLRALRILRAAGLIAAEDTRTTRKLLARYEITTPVTSYFEHNKLAKLDRLLDALREKDVALVSEAGMPGISDPGYELVRAAIEAGIEVIPIPGPSAAVTALAVSGLPTDSFLFLGFLPRKPSERRRRLQEIAAERHTIVVYEAPHRLLECLYDILDVLGDRPLAVARELTKVHEEIIRASVADALAHFTANAPRGEICLVIAGAAIEKATTTREDVETRLRDLAKRGYGAKEAVAMAAKEMGMGKKEIYRIWVEITGETS